MFSYLFNIIYLDNIRTNTNEVSRRVVCQVCSEQRIYEKYSRHLKLHVREKLITSEEMRLIIFQTKVSRKDCKNKIPNNQIGNICSMCYSHVLNLDLHLLKQHNISLEDNRYRHVSQTSEECVRQLHWRSDHDLVENPLFKPKYIEPFLPTVTEEINPRTSHISTNLPKTFDPPYNEDDDSNNDDFLDPPRLDSRKKFIQFISSFRKFLSTNWGGSKSLKSIKMDVSNVMRLFKDVGLDEIWNANSLNTYFTNLTKKGRSSITVHSKLRSLRRFIDYLTLADPSYLPSSKLVVVNSMLTGIENHFYEIVKQA